MDWLGLLWLRSARKMCLAHPGGVGDGHFCIRSGANTKESDCGRRATAFLLASLHQTALMLARLDVLSLGSVSRSLAPWNR